MTLRRIVAGLALVAAVTAAPLARDAAAEAKVGAPAPAFTLKDTAGKEHSLESLEGKIVVLEWFNHGCPFVQKYYDSGTMQKLQKHYAEKGVVWLSICSSAKGKQGHDTAEGHAKTAEKKGTASTILIDESGAVGRLYAAKTTPHMFIIDGHGVIRYAGAIDSIPSARAGDIEKSEQYVVKALDAILEGKAPEKTETKPYGCSVKY